MTPTDKDAMALTVLDAAAVDTEYTLGCPNLAARLREARAHLASRIAELSEKLANAERRSQFHKDNHMAAEAELAAVRADAERYRWLRLQCLGHAYIENILFETISDDYSPPYRSLKHTTGLDAAIDAARGGE